MTSGVAIQSNRRRITDDPFTTPGHVTPPRVPGRGEPLFEFLRGHDRILCELRYHGEWAVEAQFFKNEELFYSCRFNTRAQTVQWAEEERKALEKGAG